jgi:hypothetical protein
MTSFQNPPMLSSYFAAFIMLQTITAAAAATKQQ